MKKYLPTLLGLIGGAVIGFAWAQNTKSRIGQSIETGFNNGKFVISVDVKGAAAGGVLAMIGKGEN